MPRSTRFCSPARRPPPDLLPHPRKIGGGRPARRAWLTGCTARRAWRGRRSQEQTWPRSGSASSRPSPKRRRLDDRGRAGRAPRGDAAHDPQLRRPGERGRARWSTPAPRGTASTERRGRRGSHRGPRRARAVAGADGRPSHPRPRRRGRRARRARRRRGPARERVDGRGRPRARPGAPRRHGARARAPGTASCASTVPRPRCGASRRPVPRGVGDAVLELDELRDAFPPWPGSGARCSTASPTPGTRRTSTRSTTCCCTSRSRSTGSRRSPARRADARRTRGWRTGRPTGLDGRPGPVEPGTASGRASRSPTCSRASSAEHFGARSARPSSRTSPGSSGRARRPAARRPRRMPRRRAVARWRSCGASRSATGVPRRPRRRGLHRPARAARRQPRRARADRTLLAQSAHRLDQGRLPADLRARGLHRERAGAEGIAVNDDEIAYIAMHVGAYLEQRRARGERCAWRCRRRRTTT